MDKVAALACTVLDKNICLESVTDKLEELKELAVLFCMDASQHHGLLVYPRVRIRLFTETVVPNYSPCDYKSHFRLTRETTEVN